MKRFWSKSLVRGQNEGFFTSLYNRKKSEKERESFHVVMRGAVAVTGEGREARPKTNSSSVVFSEERLQRGERIQLCALGKGKLTLGYTLVEPGQDAEYWFSTVFLEDGDLFEVENGPGPRLCLFVNFVVKWHLEVRLDKPFIAFKFDGPSLGLLAVQRLRPFPILHPTPTGLTPSSIAASVPPLPRSAPPLPPSAPLPTLPTDECSVCYEDHMNSVLYPCGHICMCFTCASTIGETSKICPVCRQPILKVIKTFKV